jgi:prepilin-type N-terminal cleavage/methylation domain-containing protein
MERGFTLIELMIVVVVVAILAAIAYPSYNNYMAVANDNSLSLDYGRDPWTSSKVAQEYYSDKDLDKNLGLSWALNVRALETQSKFAETLYPTITVETNDVGITIRTKVTCVTRGLLNALLRNALAEQPRLKVLFLSQMDPGIDALVKDLPGRVARQ